MTMARDHRRPHRAVIPRSALVPLIVFVVAGAGAVTSLAAATAHHVHPLWHWQLPRGFPTPRVPGNNPMSSAKVALGRRLFYDPRLSGDGTESCSSCHQQRLAFTDGRAHAVGSTGQQTPRSALSLDNVAYNATLAWANPALVTLEEQMETPLFGEHPIEMGVTDANESRILARLRADAWYRVHFHEAFPAARDPISFTAIVRSIASFERTIVSADSRYDRYLRHQATLTPSQRRGMNLFMSERTGCTHCHGSFIFNDQDSYVGAPDEPLSFHNTGLYNVGGTGAYPAPSRGLFDITGLPADMGRFRAPTLRNVALTAPYMHDGSIKTLRDVIDFYAAGGRDITTAANAGDGRVNPYKDAEIAPIDLSARDRSDLVAFLKTLTDYNLINNPHLSNPFHRQPHARR